MALPTADGAPLTSIPNFASLSPNGLVKGRLGIDRFITADTDFLLNSIDQIRTLFGQPTGARPYEPNLAFFNAEDTYAFYGQAGYRLDVGGMPLDDVIGARVVNTVEQLNGNLRGLNSLNGVYYDSPRDTRTYDRTVQIGARVKF